MAKWGLDPDALVDRLDAGQLELLWAKGQERLAREADDMLAIVHAGAREGMTDVYVAMRRLRRKGPPARISGSRDQASGLTGAALETALDRWALTFPGQVN